MIFYPEKLAGCDKRVIAVFDHLEKKLDGVVCNSGYRSPEHNAQVGGAKDSAHTKGLAGDASRQNISCLKLASIILERFGTEIKGMGIDVYQNYVHFDFMDRGVNGVTYWAYGRDGKAL